MDLSFGVFMILLFSARFLIEFVKNDQVGFESGMTLNMGQFSVYPLSGGCLMIVWTKMKPHYFNQTPIPKRPKPADKKS